VCAQTSVLGYRGPLAPSNRIRVLDDINVGCLVQSEPCPSTCAPWNYCFITTSSPDRKRPPTSRDRIPSRASWSLFDRGPLNHICGGLPLDVYRRTIAQHELRVAAFRTSLWIQEHIAYDREIRHLPIPAQLVYLHWSSGHDFRLSRVKSRQARETRVRFPDGELHFCLMCYRRRRIGSFWSCFTALSRYADSEISVATAFAIGENSTTRLNYGRQISPTQQHRCTKIASNGQSIVYCVSWHSWVELKGKGHILIKSLYCADSRSCDDQIVRIPIPLRIVRVCVYVRRVDDLIVS
jgi:hypothetical protein